MIGEYAAEWYTRNDMWILQLWLSLWKYTFVRELISELLSNLRVDGLWAITAGRPDTRSLVFVRHVHAFRDFRCT